MDVLYLTDWKTPPVSPGPCEAALRDMSICDALAIWSSWTCDVPFFGATGDETYDRRIAAAFRHLLGCSGLDQRLTWIEGEVWRPEDFPHPSAAADAYRETLMRWWLDLYGEGRG